jgi:hypothetical protein
VGASAVVAAPPLGDERASIGERLKPVFGTLVEEASDALSADARFDEKPRRVATERVDGGEDDLTPNFSPKILSEVAFCDFVRTPSA